ncbi:ABC transporter permease, partial [Methanosalsum natronophilum]
MIKRTINFFKNRNIEIASLIGLIVIWQLVADYVVQRTLFLPSFTEVISALVRIIETGVLFTDIQTSLLHFGIGIGSALIVGI